MLIVFETRGKEISSPAKRVSALTPQPQGGSINRGSHCKFSPAFKLSSRQQADRLDVDGGRTKRRLNEREGKSRRHRLPPTIFDNLHRIPQGNASAPALQPGT